MQGLGKLNTAEWWVSEWDHLFTIPIESNGCCHEEALQRIISDIVKTAPAGTIFPGPCYEEPPREPDDPRDLDP